MLRLDPGYFGLVTHFPLTERHGGSARRSRALRPTACRAGWPSYCGGSRLMTNFAPLACDTLDAVMRLDPGYFGLVAHFP